MNFAHFIFATAAFKDGEASLARNVNRITGHELALWLSAELRMRGHAVSDPWAEDHGWDFDVTAGNSSYLCVCAIMFGDEGQAEQAGEGNVSIDKKRSMMDRLRGRNLLSSDDEVVAACRTVLQSCPDVAKLEIEVA